MGWVNGLAVAQGRAQAMGSGMARYDLSAEDLKIALGSGSDCDGGYQLGGATMVMRTNAGRLHNWPLR